MLTSVRAAAHHEHMTPDDEVRAVNEVTRRLAVRYPHVTVDVISAEVAAAHDRFAGCRIRDYIPLFVERSVRDRFAAEQASGPRRPV